MAAPGTSSGRRTEPVEDFSPETLAADMEWAAGNGRKDLLDQIDDAKDVQDQKALRDAVTGLHRERQSIEQHKSRSAANESELDMISTLFGLPARPGPKSPPLKAPEVRRFPSERQVTGQSDETSLRLARLHHESYQAKMKKQAIAEAEEARENFKRYQREHGPDFDRVAQEAWEDTYNSGRPGIIRDTPYGEEMKRLLRRYLGH